MENSLSDYIGLAVMFTAGTAVIWYFWSWIKDRF